MTTPLPLMGWPIDLISTLKGSLSMKAEASSSLGAIRNLSLVDFISANNHPLSCSWIIAQ